MRVDNRKTDVTLMQNLIKEEIEKLGLIYREDKKWERARISNMLKGKLINGVAKKADMDIFTFVKTIIEWSGKLSFWKDKAILTNAVKVHKHWDTIYNQILALKIPKKSVEKAESDFTF